MLYQFDSQNSMMTCKQRITHVFRLAAPYDELAPGSKSKFIKEPRRHIVEDKVKNNFLVGLMRKVGSFLYERLTVFRP